MNTIGSCLWFDDQAAEAAKFYVSLFPGSTLGATSYYGPNASGMAGRPVGSVMTVEVELPGQKILLLNGGPVFEITPALSFFVSCENEAEIDQLWKRLTDGGTALMPLDRYPWADKYGWVADRYGATWQLLFAKDAPVPRQKIAPAFLFVGRLYGKGAEAIEFYRNVFARSDVLMMQKSPDDTVLHAAFTLSGQEFRLMDGAGEHGFSFNEGFSLTVACDTQEEIDRYWSSLTEGGEEAPCGWLRDRYGVSWQLVPSELSRWTSDARRFDAMMGAMLRMKKLDLAKLRAAYEKGLSLIHI